MNENLVEDATEADIPRVVAIAEALQLKDQATENGFLGAGFSTADYAAFLREARSPEKRVSFTVARQAKNGPCVGFLLGYNEAHVKRPFAAKSEWPIGGTEASIVELLSPATYPLLDFERATFFVIKQIAVDPDFMRHGIAQSLYLKLFRETHADYFFAAIITVPRNTRSEAFHRRQGFFPVMQCFSTSKSATGENREYINRVWLKPARPMEQSMEDEFRARAEIISSRR